MVGVINQGPGNQWGVCGFVGVLNALHEDGKLQEFGKELSLASINQRVGPEVLTYLKMRSVEKPGITDAVLAFTKTFGTPYDQYQNIGQICDDIKKVVKDAKGSVGVAMPIEAVEDYIAWVGLKSSRRLESNTFTSQSLLTYKGCIVGCGYGGKNAPYFGLRHWVYVNPKGCLLNWGESIDLTTKPLPKGVADTFKFVPYALHLE